MVGSWPRATLAIVALVAASCGLARAGLDGESNTDGYNPAALGDELGEARRQAIISRQIELVDRMNWSAFYGCLLGPFEPWVSEPGDIWGYPQDERVRQPIGHESGQTGPNRWNYRPIYPEDVETLPAPDGESIDGEQAGPELPAPWHVDEVSPPKPTPERAVPRAGVKRQPRKPSGGPREF